MAALLVTAGATVLRLALDPLLQERYPLATFYGAVALAGWFWGVGPAVVAALVGYLVGEASFVAPRGIVLGHPDLLELGAYACICVALIALVYRVHERQTRLDAALAEESASRARLDAAHVAARMVEWEWDVATGAIKLSPSAEHVLGTRWNVLGGGWAIAHPDDRERMQRTVEQAIHDGRDYQFVGRMVRPDTGATQWLEIRGVVHRGRDGGVEHVTGVAIDVTDQQHTLHELARAEQSANEVRTELQTVMDVMASGVCRCSRDLTYRWASRRYLEWLEFRGASIVGRSLPEVLGPELFAAKQPYIARVLAGEAVEFEAEVPSARGRGRWIHAAYTPTRAADGTVDGWVGVVTDRSDRREIEAALADSEERLRLALEGALLGMWTTDLADGVTICTPLNYRLFGLDPGLAGPTRADLWYALIHADDRARVQAAWEAAIAAEAPYRVEYRIVRPDGELRWIDTRGYIQCDANGRPKRVLGISMDITERKLADLALREAAQRKDEFLATLAHELRNPLAPIRYASRLFRATTPPEMIEDVGRMIERQLAHMARLLDDLLDVSRITRGTLELRREVIDLRRVIEAAVEAARPLAEKLQHTIEVRLPTSSLPVDGDPTRLTQVLDNLLNNATKYTDVGGHIIVEARATETEVIVDVLDNGVGIAGDLLPRIFELFAQGDRQGRSAGGLGIGLALARQLVTLHRGTLEAFSDGPGRGSRFVMRLPRAAEAPAVVDGRSSSGRVAVLGAAGTRVLIVDDNRDAADALGHVLRTAGYVTTVTYDGVTALEIAEILQPSIVLLDLGLPNVSGHDVARRLRAQAWARSTHLIAITGWGQESEKRKSREGGFDEHLTKPVDPDVLLHLLARRRPTGIPSRPTGPA